MLTAGTRLGPYEIQAAVGSGGMGEVYKARDTRLDRTVALKVLSAQLAEDPEFRERFEREARAISQLSHPHICTLHDVGEVPGAEVDRPIRYLVMEFVEGETLAERLERRPLALDQALTFAIQIADALDKAHRTGIVHGDLKPGNVMLAQTGVKLLDFGLARQRAVSPRPGFSEAVTQTMPLSGARVVMGTLQYAAPEQLEGHQPDERTDIFALGAVIHEMVTGKKAFEGDTAARVIAAIMHGPPRLSSVQPSTPLALDHAVAGCMAKDPEDRWQHAGDLKRELKWIAAGGTAASATSPGTSRTRRWGWVAAALLLVFVAAAVGTLAYLRPAAADATVYRTSVLIPEGLSFPVPGPLGGVGRLALSPDGRQLAFVATDEQGNQMLWVRPLDSLASTPLPGTEGADSPFWSPDSSQIGFIAQFRLRRVGLEGGPPVTIAQSHNTTGSWNRDGTILFTPNNSSPLHAVPASGGQPQAVTVLDESAGDLVHRNPFFLPDGRQFLYVAVSARPDAPAGARAIYVGSLDDSESNRIVIEAASHAKYADGHLLFLQGNMLVAQPFDTARREVTGVPTPITEQVELTGASSAAFTVSETGALAYQPASGGTQLVWFTRDGRREGTVGDPAGYGDIELSPDGQRAAVSILDRTTNTRDIFILDLVRGVRSRFTSHPADDISPIWSPDGRQVIFTSNRRGQFDLFVKSTSGIGMEELLLESGAQKYPTSWAPGGESILYWSFDPESAGLWQLPLTGDRTPRRVLPFVNQGRFSPDGQWISYYSFESGRQEVYVVPFPSPSSRWQVSSVGGTLSRWRDDGGEIYYAARDNTLMAVEVSGDAEELTVGPPRPLFQARPVGRGLFYDVAPDGRFLVNTHVGENLSSSIILLQNWRVALAP